MNRNMILALACATALCGTSMAATRTCALVTTADNDGNYSHIRLFGYDKDAAKWYSIRTVVSHHDGHVRFPTSAVYVNGIVYVTEWSHLDDGTAGSIQKYDLNGKWLGTHDSQLRVSSSTVLEHPAAIVSDGTYFYVAAGGGVGGKAQGRKNVMRYGISSGWRWSHGTSVPPITLSISSSGRYLLVPNDYNSDTPTSMGEIIDLQGSNFKSDKVMLTCANASDNLAMAHGLYWDETGGAGKLYVGCYGKTKNKPFGVYDATLTDAGLTLTKSSVLSGENFYRSPFKADDRIYVWDYNNAILREASSAGTLTTAIASISLSTFETKVGMANTFTETIPDEPTLVRHWTFDDGACDAMLENSVAGGGSIRSYGIRAGAAGVRGGALMTQGDVTYGVFTNCTDLLGGTCSGFLWVGMPAKDVSGQHYLFSNRMTWFAPGYMILQIKDGKLAYSESRDPDHVSLSVVSDLVIADGKWHHVGFVRTSTGVTIYVDGVSVASDTLDATVSLFLNSSVEYVLGASAEMRESKFLVSGTVLDDLRIYDRPMTAAQVKALYDSYGVAGGTVAIPTAAPAEPTYDATTASAYGTIVAHNFSYQSAYRAPAIYRLSSGGYRVAAEREASIYSSYAKTHLWSSSDGASWAASAKNLPVGEASLFESDGTLYAFGRVRGDTYGMWHEGLRAYSAVEASKLTKVYYEMQFANTVPNRSSFAVVACETGAETLRATNHVSEMWASFPHLASGSAKVSGNTFVAPVYAGVDGSNGFVTATLDARKGLKDIVFSPEINLASSLPGLAYAHATLGFGAYLPTGAKSKTDRLSFDILNPMAAPIKETQVAFDGADRPFAVVFDERCGCLWAVTTPNGTRMDLFYSTDLSTWTYAKTLLTANDAGTTVFSNPSIVIDGAKLCVAFNLACSDGGEGPLSLTQPNFVMFKAIEHFRTGTPFAKGLTVILR